MKIQKSHLKELIRQAIKEDDEWWEKMTPPEQADYIKKHPGSAKAKESSADKGEEETDKKAGDVWKRSDGTYASMNSKGSVQGYKDKKDATSWSKGEVPDKTDSKKDSKKKKVKKSKEKTTPKEIPVKVASPKEIKKSQEKLGNIKKGEEEVKKAEQELKDAEEGLVLWPAKKIAAAKENLS